MIQNDPWRSVHTLPRLMISPKSVDHSADMLREKRCRKIGDVENGSTLEARRTAANAANRMVCCSPSGGKEIGF